MGRTGLRGIVVAAIALSVAACGPRAAQDANLDSLDNELVDAGSGNAADPAMTAALHDQIMVDPALAGAANKDTVRPPAKPYSGALPADGVAGGATSSASAGTGETLKHAPAPGACPQCVAARESLTLGALAARQKDGRTASCAADMRYSASWANRLPADVPLYPDARVSEAAGNASGACALRAVSFSTAVPMQTVLDWYYTRTSKAGYSAEHQADGAEHVLGGTRGDGGAFALFLTSRRDGGTDVDLVANNGR
ncbi:hypothetical protein [Sphingomonas immobilis]|uniref:Lipoprotein n=1 Tax=Sphingomonas immobilis TaxID=3063997 RepID=A0ABT9A495_9SPHN|nr:hypothetical protein [Sphingomonas sp. CA1-15]MDO7844666.1 hypothetical protein [Sphingomonas sp. CA1-15]